MTDRLLHYVSTAPFDPGASDTLSPELERYYMASQWRMMWWKLRRHRLAVASGFVLLAMYVAILIAEFLSVPYGQVALAAAGLRVELDRRQEKIGFKIREAQLQKVPYMLVIGDREAAEGTVAVRTRAGGDQGAMTLDAFVSAALDEVRQKRA